MKKVGLLLTMIRGAVGKKYVVKHYRYGVVVTRYPDMSGVEASQAQRKCRDVFRGAVAFAKGVFADRVRKAYYREKLGKVRGLFQAVMKAYMQAEKQKAARRAQKQDGHRGNHLPGSRLRDYAYRPALQGASFYAASPEEKRRCAGYFTRVQVSVLPMRDMPT